MFEGMARELVIMQFVVAIASVIVGASFVGFACEPDRLSAPPSSDSGQELAHTSGSSDSPLMFVVSTPDGIDSAAARTTGTHIVDELRRSPIVVDVTSPWNASTGDAAKLVNQDRTAGLVIAELAGGPASQPANTEELSAR